MTEETQSAMPGTEEAKKPRRSAAEIACDAVRRCRDDEMQELADRVVKGSIGLAMTFRDCLQRSMNPRIIISDRTTYSDEEIEL